MSRKHFRELAEAISAHQGLIPPRLLWDLMSSIAVVCASCNAHFDLQRFRVACGFDAWNRPDDEAAQVEQVASDDDQAEPQVEAEACDGCPDPRCRECRTDPVVAREAREREWVAILASHIDDRDGVIGGAS